MRANRLGHSFCNELWDNGRKHSEKWRNLFLRIAIYWVNPLPWSSQCWRRRSSSSKNPKSWQVWISQSFEYQYPPTLLLTPCLSRVVLWAVNALRSILRRFTIQFPPFTAWEYAFTINAPDSSKVLTPTTRPLTYAICTGVANNFHAWGLGHAWFWASVLIALVVLAKDDWRNLSYMAF